jgi:hypothetical protein
MRWLLLLAASLAALMRARIVETLPPSPGARPAADQPVSEEPVLVLEPIVVTESRGVKKLEKAIADDRERREAERFTPLKGGKIYSSERLDMGGWWDPATGWSFLKIKW